jgi:hypothetical protein
MTWRALRVFILVCSDGVGASVLFDEAAGPLSAQLYTAGLCRQASMFCTIWKLPNGCA